MPSIHPIIPRLSVRDSYDDDDLTDMDDEVFIRDGKSDGGIKINDDCGVKRPLMPPRRKLKSSGNFQHDKLPLRSLLIPVCYGATALIISLGLILLCILTVNIFSVPFNMLKNLFPSKTSGPIMNLTNEILPCTSLSSSIVWTRTLSKLTSEAPLRSIDVNNDGVDDIILGFSTGLDALDAPEFLCKLYFDGQEPCLGGVMALNGKTGDTLWTHWTDHAIFSIDCALDITKDDIKDCIITGRGGILHAINGNDGTIVWAVPLKDYPLLNQIILNVYDARFMHDIDGDSIGDIIVSHTTQIDNLRSSEIILLSGKLGTTIKVVEFSKSEQLFIAPQTLIHPDGEIIYLLASSTPEQSGGLYIIPQSDLLYGNTELRTLQHGKGKGVLLPPIMVDITLDGTEDIIVSSLDSTIIAYNGLTFDPIWNYTVTDSEIISIPIPGYYNDDNVPDIMVKHQIGPGFPVYYYSLSTILDGKTGKPLFDKPIKDSGNGQMSGLSLSVDGYGNDWFLYWSANCLDHDNVDEKYRFLKGQTLISQSRANLCKLRFNATLSTKLFAMSQHVGPPGQSIYNSLNYRALELNNSIGMKKLTGKYLNVVSNDNEGDNTMVNGPIVAQHPPTPGVSQKNLHNFLNQENGQLVDEQGDYFIKKNNEKKDTIGSLNLNNDLSYTASNKQISNEFPSDMEWNNPNAWDDNQMDKQYDMAYSERDADFESPPRMEDNETRNKLFGEIRKKRNNNVNNKKNNNNNGYYNEDAETGIPRQPPTGLLLPSLLKNNNRVSIDFIFTTYWLPPSEISLVLLQQDLDCIQMKEKKIFGKLNLYEREDIIAECLAERGVNYKLYKDGLDRENVKIPLGQMTIYRMKLECACPDDMLPGQTCKNISVHQSWPAHLGQHGDGDFQSFIKN
ncbi:hypothetical protein PV328_010908 [Microctonus aethiopoides]|uniref:FAM234A/B beta-propeller domain-containing protein n=2 Tax=Microctonus aethiopoides TaxID=144406 RepID=A0AA39KQN9_9HYME|nr:hypothetical protein PV328_010908 [Microctonus aethiopoides]